MTPLTRWRRRRALLREAGETERDAMGWERFTLSYLASRYDVRPADRAYVLEESLAGRPTTWRTATRLLAVEIPKWQLEMIRKHRRRARELREEAKR